MSVYIVYNPNNLFSFSFFFYLFFSFTLLFTFFLRTTVCVRVCVRVCRTSVFLPIILMSLNFLIYHSFYFLLHPSPSDLQFSYLSFFFISLSLFLSLSFFLSLSLSFCFCCFQGFSSDVSSYIGIMLSVFFFGRKKSSKDNACENELVFYMCIYERVDWLDTLFFLMVYQHSWVI